MNIKELKQANKILRREIKRNNDKIAKLKATGQLYRWQDFSMAVSSITLKNSPHPMELEGSRPTVKIINTLGISVSVKDILGNDEKLNTLVKCEKTGNTWFTQRRFLAEI